MTRSRLRFALLAFALTESSCSVSNPEPDLPPQALLHREFLAMGTRISVSLRVDHRREDAHDAIDAARKSIEEFGQRWWAWGDGDLAAINRDLAAGHAAEIPAAMQALFARAWEIRLASEGRFEPRIGALVRIWGFDDVARIRATPPDRGDIRSALKALRAAPGYDGGPRYGPAPGVAWDFGAIAKGWVVDVVLAQLHSRGFADALVDAGGNLAARGSPGARPWRVAIRDARAETTGRQFLATLDIRDESVNTHADDQRFFVANGHRYGHILDPASGWPARALVSVTVVHHDGALADAGGLALLVAGPSGWQQLAGKLGLDQVLVVDEQGRAIATQALAQRLHPAEGVSIRTVP